MLAQILVLPYSKLDCHSHQHRYLYSRTLKRVRLGPCGGSIFFIIYSPHFSFLLFFISQFSLAFPLSLLSKAFLPSFISLSFPYSPPALPPPLSGLPLSRFRYPSSSLYPSFSFSILPNLSQLLPLSHSLPAIPSSFPPAKCPSGAHFGPKLER